MPSQRLILVAHGETDATRRGLFPADEHLNARGREAAALQEEFPSAAEVLISTAPAAIETAMMAGLEGRAESALADLDLGLWRGQSFEMVASNDPAMAMAWIEDPAFAGHGGESFDALILRVGRWARTRLDVTGATIAFTHAAIVRAAAIAALELPPAAIWRIEIAPLARLTLGGDGRRWTLRELIQT